jgi:hypothetical protein
MFQGLPRMGCRPTKHLKFGHLNKSRSNLGCHGLDTPQSNLNDVSPRHEDNKQDVKDDGDNE